MKILLLADHAEPRLWEELDRRKLEVHPASQSAYEGLMAGLE